MTEQPGLDLPEHAARLEAGMWALLQASNDAELRAARKFVLKLLHEPSPEEKPKAYARVGGVLAYLKAGVPTGPLPAGPLARFYAEAYTALALAGIAIPEGELESADDELAPHGWGVELSPSGTYQAVKLSEEAEAPAPRKYAKHKFSTTHVVPPPAIVNAVLAVGRAIPDADLAEDGREAGPHVTVKYGVHGDDHRPVADIISQYPPLKMRVGRLSLFPAKEGADFDVLKFEVEGDGLRRLNRAVSRLPHTDTHPTYNPHLTVAYLKAGTGRKYLGAGGGLTGRPFTANEVVFSDTAGRETLIPLKGQGGPKLRRPVQHAMHSWDVQRHQRARSALHYAAIRAPAGGVYISGVFYKGGTFIPSAQIKDDDTVALPTGQQMKGGDLKRAIRKNQAVGSARRRASRDADPKLAESVASMTAAYRIRPDGSAPPDAGRAARAFRVLKAANGERTAGRLKEIVTLLAAAIKAAPPGRRAPLLKVMAELGHMARLLLPASPHEAEAIKLAYPDGGRLWLVPGPEDEGRQEFLAQGFREAVPGRWAGEDTAESRQFAEEKDYRLVEPDEPDEE